MKFLLTNEFDKQDKMQLLGKLKKNSLHGVQSHLRFSRNLKLKLSVLSADYSVAMVTYCVTKMTLPCLPVIGQCFDDRIVASIDKE